MKRFVVSIIAAGTVAFAGYNVSLNNSRQTDMSDIALANVEALASGEQTVSHSLTYGSGVIKMCKARCGIHQVELEAWGNGSPVTLTCTTN